MSENKHSTSGLSEDLLRSFIQVGCAELHLKTLMEKRISELENGMVSDDDFVKHLDVIDDIEKDMEELAQIRREEMLYIFNAFGGKGDKEQWCMVKHLGLASFTAFEAYQASDKDQDLWNIAFSLNKKFIKAMTKFIGAEEWTDCQSCFSDFLKAKGDNEDNNETDNL